MLLAPIAAVFSWLGLSLVYDGVSFALFLIKYWTLRTLGLDADPKRRAREGSDYTPDVLIIGAGVSGIGAAYHLKQRGIPFTLVEKSKAVGGTWHENKYPGAACDVPSYLYSFSFDPKPDWSRSHAGRKEIQQYLHGVAERAGILSHVKLSTHVTSLTWDKDEEQWYAALSDGKTITARAVISGIGGLHVPNTPNFPGIDKFKGKAMHSAQWDESTNVEGKRVVIVGSAASAVQLIPQIVDKVKNLTVLQRTPNWIFPADMPLMPILPTGPYPAWFHSLVRAVPGFATLYRLCLFLFQEFLFWPLGIWTKPKNGGTSLGQKFAKYILTDYLTKTVKDPELLKKLMPTYPVGCKRILRDPGYLNAVQKPNVNLVTAACASFDETAVIDANGDRHEADIVVFATGFKVGDGGGLTITDADGDVNRVGLSLKNKKLQKYLGMTGPELPNFFYMLGPQTGLGHNSIIFILECQAEYIAEALCRMSDRKIATIRAKASAVTEFDRWCRQLMQTRVWLGLCNSWYQNANGDVVTLWPSSCMSYFYHTRHVDDNAYEYTYIKSIKQQ